MASAAVFCVRNQTRSTMLCSRAKLARGLEGTRGLLGRRQLDRDEGLIIEVPRFLPVMWIHTCFMRFPIDILFLGRGHTVIKIETSLQPWRFSPIVLGAYQAIELNAGVVMDTRTAVGDKITLGKTQAECYRGENRCKT